MDKKCPKCKEIKPGSDFHNNKSRKDGKEWCCKSCRQVIRQEVYTNRRLAEIRKVRQWQMDNPVKVSEYKKKYHQENPMKQRYANLKNKSRAGMELSQKDFLAWYDKEPKQCFYCDIPSDLLNIPNGYIGRKSNGLFTIDRKDCKGNYAEGNIVLACPLCNLVKTNFFSADTMRDIAQKYIKPRWQQEAGIEPDTLKPTEEEIRKKLVTAYQKIIGTLNERNAKRLGDARKAVAEEIKNMKLPLTYIKGVLRPDGRPLHPAIDKSGEEVQQDLLKAILDKLDIKE